jgi:hypothetical protein
LPVDFGSVARDKARLLQVFDATPTRCRAQADPLRQLGVGEPALGLQLIKDGKVKFVKCFHEGLILERFLRQE